MNLNEAKQILKDNGYFVEMPLDEALDYLKENGYLYEAEEDTEETDDFEADEEEDGDDEEMSEDLKNIVDKLRGIKNYEQYVSFLKGMKDDQTKLLGKLIGDGEFSKDVKVQTGSLGVKFLHPTQQEIDVNNSLAFPLSKKPESIPNILKPSGAITINNSPIIVYKHEGSYYIIDGHHRWSQVFLMNPKAKMKIILFSAPKGSDESPVDMLRDFQLVIKAKTGDVKIADADSEFNVYKMSSDAIKNYVMKITTDAAVEQWASVKEGATKESIADYIVTNAEAMKQNNGPAEGAPRRNVMPQTDKATIKAAAKGMMDI